MDIMELGAIGELVGGVAVIATLIYLAVQIRQGNQLERAETHRAFIQQWNHVVHEPLLRRETSSILRSVGRDFAGSSGDDQLVGHGYWTGLALLGQQAFFLERAEQIDPTLAEAANRVVLRILKIPGATEWWNRAKVDMVQDYVVYLDHLDRENVAPYTDTCPWYASLQGDQ